MQRFFVALLLSLLAAAAAAESASRRFSPAPAEPSRWTPEALAAARPLAAPALRPKQAPRGVVAADELPPFRELFPPYAQEPTLAAAERRRFGRRLYDFSRRELRLLRGLGEAGDSVDASAKNYGSSGLDYTSSRLIPSSAVETFPYSAVGKLFFSDGSEDFVCSGAVIAKRLVITAGRCVHGGPLIGFYQDFLFVPALLDGQAPFGDWSASSAWVTREWATAQQAPADQDYALLVIADQDGQRIGEVTGHLSFQTDLLADNHLHLLGYAVNLDDGEELHQVSSGDWFDFGDGTVAYGSDMAGGSEGGPWVQNFNRKSSGQAGGRNRQRAAVVGVTSYWFLDGSVKAQGASVLTRQFRVLRRDACLEQAGNC